MFSPGATHFVLYRLTTDDNALRKGWYMLARMAVGCIWLFNINVFLSFDLRRNGLEFPAYQVSTLQSTRPGAYP